MKSFSRITFAALGVLAVSPQSYALDQIIREYQSTRSSGMGGVRMTTGLYDENFFANPARVTANPDTKFQLFEFSAEGSNPSNVASVVSHASGDGKIVSALGDTAGTDTHARFQTAFPAFYVASNDERRWAFAFGLFTSTQVDVDLRQNFQMGAQAIVDVGPAVTFGYKLLHDKLSVGGTLHAAARVGADPNFTFAQLLQNKSLSPLKDGGSGAMIDADLGATYELPIFRDSPFKFTVAAAIDNLLGGNFTNLSDHLISGLTCTRSDGSVGTCPPPSTPRSLGFGGAISRTNWGVFSNTTFALEFTDIGADSNANIGGSSPNPAQYGHGSVFRTIHMGGETHWRFIGLRAGFNQGYPTAGVGFDLRFITIDASTYGEEMSLNTGGIQDRRYAIQFGIQI